MAFWLLKSEPDVFSWRQLLACGREPWTGVRNHLAKRHLAAMRVGEQGFFYHSNVGRAVVGTLEIVRAAYPDPTVADPDGARDWCCVDVRPLATMPRPVTLAAIRAEPALAGIALLRQSRLSVQPVEDAAWRRICEMGGLAP